MPKILGAPEYIAVRVLRDGTAGSEGWEAVAGPGAERAGLRGRIFKLRRASKPLPGDVFLVLGDLKGAGKIRFEDLAEVTWAGKSVYPHDLAYRPVRWRK